MLCRQMYVKIWQPLRQIIYAKMWRTINDGKGFNWFCTEGEVVERRVQYPASTHIYISSFTCSLTRFFQQKCKIAINCSSTFIFLCWNFATLDNLHHFRPNVGICEEFSVRPYHTKTKNFSRRTAIDETGNRAS